MFRLTGLKILERIGTHFTSYLFLETNIILCILKAFRLSKCIKFGPFWGFKILNLNGLRAFRVSRKTKIFWGYEVIEDIFFFWGGGGHHKNGLVLGVISMHFRVFS